MTGDLTSHLRRERDRPAGTPAACGQRRDGWQVVQRWFARHRQAWFGLLMIAVLAAGALAVYRLAAGTDPAAVVATLLDMPNWRLAAAIGLTVASFGALTLYDLNAFAALGQPKRWRDIAPCAFAAFAISQTVGFGPLSGAAVRMRFYTPLGVKPLQVAQVVGFITLSFAVGLVALGAAGILVAAAEVVPVVAVPEDVLRLTGFGLLAIAGLLLLRGGSQVSIRLFGLRRFRLPGRPVMLRQLAVSAADIAAAAGVLWVLLPQGAIGYPAFLPVFTVAIAIGVLSHVPAGLGVFEAIVLAALGDTVPTAAVLAALALYRLVYHGFPVVLASLGIAAAEIGRLGGKPVVRDVLAAFAGLAPQAVAALALMLGAMLVFSGVTPADPDDLDWLQSMLPLPLLEGAHFLASLLGAVLMIAARGLALRLDGAWAVALAAAATALVLSIAKALALYEAGALVLFAALLLATRQSFYRPATIFSQPLTPRWLAALACVLVSALALLFFVYGHAEFGIESWARFEFAAEAPRGLRALVGTSLVVGLAGLWSLLRPAADVLPPTGADELARAVAIVSCQGAADANLVRMGDKRLLFSADGRGFIMYGCQGGSLIALFDPVGPRAVWPDLVWRFVEMAERMGRRAAFYQVGAAALSLYVDAGLHCLKLGEDARIDLTRFTLQGPAQKQQRYVAGRGIRDGLTVDLLDRAGVAAQFDDLARISASWLLQRGGGEKAFSLGAFRPGYVRQLRVAVLRRDGQAMAFATLLETATGEEVAIDLMRHAGDCPAIGMEFLFLRLIELLQAEGVQWLDLGMAPLSGLSASAAAPTWHRIGRTLFEHGNRYYNFKGLRGFKEKFQPAWRPRYLAVHGGLNPAIVLIDVARLIGGGLKEAAS